MSSVRLLLLDWSKDLQPHGPFYIPALDGKKEAPNRADCPRVYFYITLTVTKEK